MDLKMCLLPSGIPNNAIIKCDIEGAELSCLQVTNMGNVYKPMIKYHDCQRAASQILESQGFSVDTTDNPNSHVTIVNMGMLYNMLNVRGLYLSNSVDVR